MAGPKQVNLPSWKNKMTSVFVGHLPLDMTKLQLYKLFKDNGEIGDLHINPPTNPSMKYNYGFVRFTDKEAAAKAIEELDGWPIRDWKLRVEYAEGESNQLKSRGDRSSRREGGAVKVKRSAATVEDLENVDKLRDYLESVIENPEHYKDYIPRNKGQKNVVPRCVHVKNLVRDVDRLENSLVPAISDGGHLIDIDLHHLDSLVGQFQGE